MKKLSVRQRQERPHVALPMNTAGSVRPNAHVTIEGKNGSVVGLLVDEMAVSRASVPYFDVEDVQIDGKTVVPTLMPGSAADLTHCYDIPPTRLPANGKITMRVRNKSDEPQQFYSCLMGVQL